MLSAQQIEFKLYIRHIEKQHKLFMQGMWKSLCLFTDKGNLTDLEFRLYWAIPASFYYKWSRVRRGKIKFRRYNSLSKAQYA